MIKMSNIMTSGNRKWQSKHDKQHKYRKRNSIQRA